MKAIILSSVVLTAVLALPIAYGAESEDEYQQYTNDVIEEQEAVQRARALEPAPETPPPPSQVLVDEAMARREAAKLESEQTGPPAETTAPAAGDLEKAAQELVEREHQQEQARHDESVKRLMESAKDHMAEGRWAAAIGALGNVLRLEPANATAKALLEEAEKKQAGEKEEELAPTTREERAASLRDMDAAGIPYASTLTLPKDWEEKTVRAATERAEALQAKEDPARTQLETALKKKVSIQAIELPVSDLAAYLRDAAGIDIVVDPAAAKKTFSLELKDATVASVLDWVAKLTEMAYTIRGGVVHIGPPQTVAEAAVIRVYDVSDILQTKQLLARGQNMRRAIMDTDAVPLYEVESKSSDELAEDLIGFIKEATGRRYWENANDGRSMVIRLGRLVVNAEPSMQEKIAVVIEGIRE